MQIAADSRNLMRSFLDMQSLGRLSQVHTTFFKEIGDEPIWRKELDSYFPEDVSRVISRAKAEKDSLKKQAKLMFQKASRGVVKKKLALIRAFRIDDQAKINEFFRRAEAHCILSLNKTDGLERSLLEYAAKNKNINAIKKICSWKIYEDFYLKKALEVALAEPESSFKIIDALLANLSQEAVKKTLTTLNPKNYAVILPFLKKIGDSDPYLQGFFRNSPLLARVIKAGDKEAFDFLKKIIYIRLNDEDEFHLSNFSIALTYKRFDMARDILDWDRQINNKCRDALQKIFAYCSKNNTEFLNLSSNNFTFQEHEAFTYLRDYLPSLAFDSKHLMLVRFCVEILGISINDKSPNEKMTYFYKTLKVGNFLIVRYCLERYEQVCGKEHNITVLDQLNLLLYHALRAQNFAAASYYILKGATFSHPESPTSQTARLPLIHYAASNVISFLIKQNVRFNYISFINKQNLLFEAVKKGDLESVQLFFRLNMQQNENRIEASSQRQEQINLNIHKSLLHLAASKGNIEIVKILLQQPTINYDSYMSNAPLTMAVVSGYVDVVDLLINHPKINVNKGDLLNSAVNKRHYDIIKKLLDHPHTDLSTDNEPNQCLLHNACGTLSLDIIELLLQYPELDINHKNNEGNSPLHVAATAPFGGKRNGAIDLLIKHGADVNLENADKKTLLSIIIKNGSATYTAEDKECIEIDRELVKKIVTLNREIVLPQLSQEIKPEIGSLILSRKLYDLAGEAHFNRRIIEAYRAGGVDINFKLQNDNTLLFHTIINHHFDCAKFLMEHNAEVKITASNILSLLCALEKADSNFICEFLDYIQAKPVLERIDFNLFKQLYEYAERNENLEIIRRLFTITQLFAPGFVERSKNSNNNNEAWISKAEKFIDAPQYSSSFRNN